MGKIWYLAYYNTPASGQTRAAAIAACPKVDYIAKSIRESGFDVCIVSAAHATKEACPERTVLNKDGVEVQLLASPERRTGGLGRLQTLCFRRRLLRHLLHRIQREDTLLVYHSLALIGLVRTVARRVGCRLVLEVEEQYSDVTGDKRAAKRELSFFPLADGYLVSTKLLENICNKRSKPCAVAHGIYTVQPLPMNPAAEDGLIHVVYAGTFQTEKMGSALKNAIEAARYLPATYHLHILGFGDQADMEAVKQQIRDVSRRAVCGLTYDGCLLGEAFTSFLQSCHIGLSPQSPSADFTATSFPSKVLSYLSCGLRVISTPVVSVTTSAIADLLVPCDFSSAEKIAEAILSIHTNEPFSATKRLMNLHTQFVEELKILLGGL